MKSIAFFMQIDWNLIKQRPHFFVEYLSQQYKIDVFYIKALKRGKNLVKNIKPENINKFLGFIRLPFSENLKIIKNTQNIINKKVIDKIYKTHYDYIYIPSPRMLDFIDITKLSCTKIIYDCMDDILEFSKFKTQYEKFKDYEEKILTKADFIISSSHNLSKVLTKRGCTKPIHIINNACQPKPIDYQITPNTDKFNIMYFGIISSWFDYEVLLKVLETFNDVNFTIVGPNEVKRLYHPRIKYIEALPHEKLYELAQTADAFIMPFKVNSLILSVDPIKVYEYISFLKPSFIIKYSETEKFSEFVELYSTTEELIEKIKKVKSNYYKLDFNKVECFLEDNSWNSRVEKLITIIETQ